MKEISENRKEAVVRKYEWSIRQKLMLDENDHSIGADLVCRDYDPGNLVKVVMGQSSRAGSK